MRQIECLIVINNEEQLTTPKRLSDDEIRVILEPMRGIDDTCEHCAIRYDDCDNCEYYEEDGDICRLTELYIEREKQQEMEAN